MAKIVKNEQVNGVEIYFDGKPAQKIIEQLKQNHWRWHNAKKCWYNKATAQNVDFAESLAGSKAEQNSPKAPQRAKRLSLWERTRTDKLPSYGREYRENEKRLQDAGFTVDCKNGYDKRVAAYIRNHLRLQFPEVKFSVTSGGAGWLSKVSITIKASPYKRERVFKDKYTGQPDKYGYMQNSDELEAVLTYCKALHSSFDADDGDHYADYGAHHDLYGDASIDYDYQQTEQSAEILADCQDFQSRKAEHEQAEAERRAQEWAERKRQAEEQRKQAEIAEQQRKATAQKIVDFVTVEDLPDAEQIAVCGLVVGIGKENSLDEINDYIDEQMRKGAEVYHRDLIVSRKIHFNTHTDEQKMLFTAFCNMFLYDWEFLQGKGGSATEDVRIDGKNWKGLTAEQSRSVHWFDVDCVGVYLNGVLQFVIDPQGFNYARYVAILPKIFDEAEQIRPANEYRTTWKTASEKLPPFTNESSKPFDWFDVA